MDLVRVGAAYLMVPVYPGCWIAVLPYYQRQPKTKL